MKWSDIFSIALKGLFLRKLRTFLSTLGIVFGVAAFISMMSIGEGAKKETMEQIKLLGTNNIRIKHLKLTGERQEESERQYWKGLTYDDAILIQERISPLNKVAPMKFVDSEVRFKGRQSIAQVVGTNSDYLEVTNFRVQQGRFVTPFDLMDMKNICVLGFEVKEELFGYQDPIDATIRIGQLWFTVVGVMEPKVIRKGKTTVIEVRNINRDVYVPVTTAIRRFPEVAELDRIEEIAIKVGASVELPNYVRLIKEILNRKHRDVQDYEVVVPEELLAQANRAQRIFNIVMGSIACLSLLVGGIGIMNIMLANVSERTREIGIRRAIGATKRAIMAQFLIETVFVCLTGGVIGIILGYGIAKIITLYATWETGFSFISVAIAFGMAASVGLIFGLFPARRAAQLNPVQALRSE